VKYWVFFDLLEDLSNICLNIKLLCDVTMMGSSIVGQTCFDMSQGNDPAALIEFYLPIQEYLPGQHVPNISAHACKDIQELVKTEYSGSVSNKYVKDLAFV